MIMNLLTSPVAEEELDACNATGEQVLALRVSDKVPVWILAAQKEQDRRSDSEYIKDYQAKRLDIARLYSHARLIWVNSGHGIPLEKPDEVISVIREAVQ